MKVFIIFLTIILFSYSASCQKRTVGRIIKKEEFIHTWTLSELRNRNNVFITNKVAKKTLRFTFDSVFIQTNDKQYRGVWMFEKEQIQIYIPNCSECDYKWTVISGKTICFRIGEDRSLLECFSPVD